MNSLGRQAVIPAQVRFHLVRAAALLLASLAVWLAFRGGEESGLPTPETENPEQARKLRAFRARQARRAEVVRAVISGRMSLLEAAARFDRLKRMPPAVRDDLFALMDPEATAEERLCRDVLSRAVFEAGTRSLAEAEEVRRRLTAELEQALRSGLRLPEVEEMPLLERE
jgi:hypothetical protein